MAIAWVQDDQASGSSATLGVTFGSNTTSGNMIIVVIGTAATSLFALKVTDSQGNIYKQIIKRNESTTPVIMEVWYAINITGGVTPTVTATFPIGNPYLMSATEVTGVDVTAPLDLIYSAPQVSPTGNIWTLGPTMMPRADNEFVFVCASAASLNPTWSAGTGYSNAQTQTAASSGNQGTESKVISARATQTPTFNNNSAVHGVMMMFTFADVPIAQTEYPTQINNYQFFKASDPAGTGNLSVTEKIR